MSFAEILGIAACALLICLTMLWLISLALKNSSIVDVFWGFGFIVAGWIYFAFTPPAWREGFGPIASRTENSLTGRYAKPKSMRYRRIRARALTML